MFRQSMFIFIFLFMRNVATKGTYVETDIFVLQSEFFERNGNFDGVGGWHFYFIRDGESGYITVEPVEFDVT